MEIQTSQSMLIPDDVVFVEDFRVSIEEDGLHVYCKSKAFNDFIRNASDADTRLADHESFPNALFSLKGVKIRRLSDRFLRNQTEDVIQCLNIYSHNLINRDYQLAPNLGFLMVEGLDEGIDLRTRLPVSIPMCTDYYHTALQGLQQLYAEYLRPTIIKASMREVFSQRALMGLPEDE